MFLNCPKKKVTVDTELPKARNPLAEQLEHDLLSIDDFDEILVRSGLTRNDFLSLMYEHKNVEWAYRQFKLRQTLTIKEQSTDLLFDALPVLESILKNPETPPAVSVEASKVAVELHKILVDNLWS